MRKRDRSLLANAASLLVCGVLAGIVVAAAAFPVIAMSGLAAKAGADGFGQLPTELDVPTPPQITYIYASDNKTLIGTMYDENRHDIPLSQVAQVMKDAIVAAEDQRFYDHHGVDIQGMMRAFVANQSTDGRQGASTLTMQYVRQAITYSATSPSEIIAATEQTNARKLREARLALSLETALSKDQILERYLNIASFGHGAYGIYAASQVYFNKEPKNLTLEEAALLAGLPKAPSTNDPTTAEGRPRALERRGYVLDQMAELGMVSKAQAETAKNSKLNIYGKVTPRGCVATTQNHWGFFCDYFYRWWLSQEAFGRDANEREAKLKAGGYRIVTTLDVNVQASAKKNVEAQLKTGNSDALMLAAIEPGTGRVKAMAANRFYGLDTTNNKISTDPAKRKKGIKGTYPTTSNPLLSGGPDLSGYKAGSTFKMFTMLAALEKGYTLDFTIVARSPYPSPVYIVGRGDISVCPDHVHWCPKNANPSYMNGPRNMWAGFGRSVNTYFVPLEEKAGADNAIAMAKRLGVQFRNANDIEVTSGSRAKYFGPFTIGVTDTVPLELANAYATVAADGKYCKPIPVIDVYDGKGQKLPGVATPSCSQVIRPEVARAAADAARCPIYDEGGLGRCSGGTAGFIGGRRVASIIGHPVFGKTGTADENWTANLVVSTKQLAIAGTLANPDHAETPHDGRAAERVNTAVTYTMRDALKNAPKIQFIRPPNSLIYGKKASIPDVTCKTVDEATRTITQAGFEVQVEEKKIDSPCPDGTVAKTDPTGSTSKGGSVLLFISNGKSPGGPRGGGPGGGGGGGGPGGGIGGGGLPGGGIPVPNGRRSFG